jgi:hypothetical protein
MNEREKLIEKLRQEIFKGYYPNDERATLLAIQIYHFILADRKRVLSEIKEPLERHTWGHKSVEKALEIIKKYGG